MRPDAPVVLLHAWERGIANARERSLALLEAGCPAYDETESRALSVGRRDSLLLAFRERVFGPQFAAWVVCPSCTHGLELQFSAADVKANLPAADEAPFSCLVDDYSVCFRAPSVDDLAGIDPDWPQEQQRAGLLANVVSLASKAGQSCTASDLPDAVIDAIEHLLEERDAAVAMSLQVHCEACGQKWDAPFDVASYLWTEIERWASHLLWEVHLLARAYAWKESDLLAMSPWRRRRYLEMLDA
jgi:hypothetical protein